MRPHSRPLLGGGVTPFSGNAWRLDGDAVTLERTVPLPPEEETQEVAWERAARAAMDWANTEASQTRPFDRDYMERLIEDDAETRSNEKLATFSSLVDRVHAVSCVAGAELITMGNDAYLQPIKTDLEALYELTIRKASEHTENLDKLKAAVRGELQMMESEADLLLDEVTNLAQESEEKMRILQREVNKQVSLHVEDSSDNEPLAKMAKQDQELDLEAMFVGKKVEQGGQQRSRQQRSRRCKASGSGSQVESAAEARAEVKGRKKKGDEREEAKNVNKAAAKKGTKTSQRKPAAAGRTRGRSLPRLHPRHAENHDELHDAPIDSD